MGRIAWAFDLVQAADLGVRLIGVPVPRGYAHICAECIAIHEGVLFLLACDVIDWRSDRGQILRLDHPLSRSVQITRFVNCEHAYPFLTAVLSPW